MIILVASYDPDYFADNTFVISDFETRPDSQAMTRVPLGQSQFRNFATTNTDKILLQSVPNELQAAFTSRSFDAATLGAAEQWTGKIVGNYGLAMTGLAQYPAQDNPIVRVNVTSFDLSDTNATNNSTTPVVG